MFYRKCRNELKTFFKCYCTNSKTKNIEESLKSHIYCKPLFTSYVELAKLLSNNVIYNNKGLLILNRPHGLKKEEPKERGFWLKKLHITKTPTMASIEDFTFSGVIPYLKKELNLNYLELLKTPDRHMSGISVLGYHKTVIASRVSKVLNSPNKTKYTFLVVCNGIPISEFANVQLGLTLLERGGSKKPIFVKNYSKRSVEQRKVFPLTMNHKVLSVNEDLQVSLIELQTNKNKWNGLRAYCAMRLLAPILGDNIFGSCVQEIGKVKVALDLFSPAATRPCKLGPDILNKLELEQKQQSVIPLHSHLAKLDFVQYRTDGRIFTAKPPDHFMWTCNNLGLTVPEDHSENRVSERFEKTRLVLETEEELDPKQDIDDDGESSDEDVHKL